MQRQKNSLHIILTQPCQKSIPHSENREATQLQVALKQFTNPAKSNDGDGFAVAGVLCLPLVLA
ncbi:hypothetical protein NIES4106_13400 [Fischerella sp. NIES-4106]|jgi:hypothetical protein|nr:hypothetical protein NIES4106_13400 [Fischerella sp. NIES-4106]